MTKAEPKNNDRTHQFKYCDKCETMKPPEGGIQMKPGRWLCANCWLKRYRY